MNPTFIRFYSIFYYSIYSIRYLVSPLKVISLNQSYLNINEGHYSKFEMNKIIPIKNRLKTILIKPEDDVEILANLIEKELNFPVILKPDWGESSLRVVRVDNQISLRKILIEVSKENFTYIAQQYNDSSMEVDIVLVFDGGKSRIVDITGIEKPKVLGDGFNTVERLIKDKYKLSRMNLFDLNCDLSRIPAKDEKVILTHINSISNGSDYVNISLDVKNSQSKIMENFSYLNKLRVVKVSVKTDSIDSLINGEYRVIETNILFPLISSVLNNGLSREKKLSLLRNYMKELVMLIKNSVKGENISFYNQLNFYVKNLRHKGKLKRNG